MRLTTYLPSNLLTKDYLGRQVALVILNKGYNLSSHPNHHLFPSSNLQEITTYPTTSSMSSTRQDSLVQLFLFPHDKGYSTRSQTKGCLHTSKDYKCKGSCFFLLLQIKLVLRGIRMCKAVYQIKSLPPLPVNHLPVIVQPLLSKVDQARKKTFIIILYQTFKVPFGTLIPS